MNGKNDKPNAAERGQLISKLVQMDFVGQDLSEFITSGKTYGEISEDLINHIQINNEDTTV